MMLHSLRLNSSWREGEAASHITLTVRKEGQWWPGGSVRIFLLYTGVSGGCILAIPDSDKSTPPAIRISKHKTCMFLSRDFEGERFEMAREFKW